MMAYSKPTKGASVPAKVGSDDSLDKAKAAEFNSSGNRAFQRGDHLAAIKAFTRGLELDPGNPNNYIFYSNRSAAYFALGDYPNALKDAEAVLRRRPGWAKGYNRKAAALMGCKEPEKAADVYREGLVHDPGNALLLEGLEIAQGVLQSLGSKGTGSVRPMAKTAAPAPSGPLSALANLRALDAEWSLVTFKDRLWLHENGGAFRPQTAIVVDLSHTSPSDSSPGNYLSLRRNRTRKPWAVAQLLEMIVEAARKLNVRPAKIATTDYQLFLELLPHLTAAGIQCTNKPTSGLLPVTHLINKYLESSEALEEASWVADPANQSVYSSLLWKRRQAGMLKTPATQPHLVEGLLRNAAAYYRSELYKKFTGYVELHIPPNAFSSIISIVGTGNDQHGIAKHSSVEDMIRSESGVGQVTSFMFADITALPFDDVEDIEHYQWEIAGPHAYPLVVVHNDDGSTQRPSASVLEWFEVAFGALLEFGHALQQPGQLEDPTEKITMSLTVTTYLGPIAVNVTLPPRGGAASPAVGSPTSGQRASPQKADAPMMPGFSPTAEFQGARPGFVFQAGPSGVGYYPDPMTAQQPSVTTPTPQKPATTSAVTSPVAAKGPSSVQRAPPEAKPEESKTPARASSSPSAAKTPLSELTKLTALDKEWTLLIVKDRQWLQDDGGAFRPQTAILVDLSRTSPSESSPSSHLSLRHNRTRKPWAVAQLLEMIVEAARKLRGRPAKITVTDVQSFLELEPHLSAMDIQCISKPAAGFGPVREAVARYLATSEAQEEAAWTENPTCSRSAYSALLWKRAQPGLLKTPATHPHMIEGLLRNAAAFYRSGLYKKFMGYVEMTFPSVPTPSIISMVGTGKDQPGIAWHPTVEDMLRSESGEGRVVSFMFDEVTALPFDDVDDIEHYHLETAGPRAFPLVLVYNEDGTTTRPPAVVLEWFEIAFAALLGFGEKTFLKPGYILDPSKRLTIDITVSTHCGSVPVTVSLPPSAEAEAEPQFQSHGSDIYASAPVSGSGSVSSTVNSAEMATRNAQAAYLRARSESRVRSSSSVSAGDLSSPKAPALELAVLRDQLATALQMLSEERQNFSKREGNLRQEIRTLQVYVDSLSKHPATPARGDSSAVSSPAAKETSMRLGSLSGNTASGPKRKKVSGKGTPV